MAVLTETSHKKYGKRTRVIQFTHDNAFDSTVMIEVPEPLAAMSVQVTGVFENSGPGLPMTVELKGSNNGLVVNRQSLPTAVAFTGTGIKSVATADLGFRHYVLEVINAGSNSGTVTTVVVKVM